MKEYVLSIFIQLAQDDREDEFGKSGGGEGEKCQTVYKWKSFKLGVCEEGAGGGIMDIPLFCYFVLLLL